MEYGAVKKLLSELCGVKGTSGLENDVAEKVTGLLSEYMPCKTDALGNVTGSKGEGHSILLDAHLDQIGLVVTGITDDGFLKIAKVGGADIRVLTAARVTIHGREKIPGVVTSVPPHLKSAKDDGKAPSFDEITIDTGMTAEQAKKIVSPGDRITFDGPFDTLIGNRIASPSIDDRAGVAAILRCLQLLEGKKTCRIDVLFSAQEETGGSGAKTGAFNSQADEAIACDVSFASAPDVSKEKYASLGEGTLIGYAPSLDYEMSRRLSRLAKEKDIPAVPEVMGGKTGTDGDDIQVAGRGIPSALLSIPIRNMHTAVEVVDLADIESTARLMAEYILERSSENA
ncbi:MAG: M20/M25/M40 family metallo-hydrolase [Clostridia bacterium]|nr:M20/M25/M40 family metallo-hydrolase [Clostridia bacterium]